MKIGVFFTILKAAESVSWDMSKNGSELEKNFIKTENRILKSSKITAKTGAKSTEQETCVLVVGEMILIFLHPLS